MIKNNDYFRLSNLYCFKMTSIIVNFIKSVNEDGIGDCRIVGTGYIEDGGAGESPGKNSTSHLGLSILCQTMNTCTPRYINKISDLIQPNTYVANPKALNLVLRR